ncbi:hypothetical protein [Nodularia spumigena]|uniref:hypothetical protein n=1 Tax=Nodularia spumigena TaxID=70799 RepID=UPI00232E6BF7|nr:hypothetical protein [Nodularia spumigena]MDB9368761.1 hypothetical protein [Nodularia spumigena CS-586/05]
MISVGVACALRLQLKKLFPTPHSPPTQVSMATPRKLSKIKAAYYICVHLCLSVVNLSSSNCY